MTLPMRPTLLFALPLVTLWLACSSKPRPAAPGGSAPAASASEVVSAPPPPAKCESLDEKCVGEAGKRARVVLRRLTFVPPPAWSYAQEDDQTIAMSGGARMAIGIYDSPDEKDPRKVAKARDAALQQLLQRLSLTAPKKPMPWGRKADRISKEGGLEISMWQIDGASLDKSHGPLLLAHARLPGAGGLVVIAFVPDDDKANSDEAILAAIASIQFAPDNGEPKPAAPPPAGAKS